MERKGIQGYAAAQKVFFFDKDNTLTPANKSIEADMKELMVRLSQRYPIIILTARDIDICREQIGVPLSKSAYVPENIIFGCTNGTQIYMFDTNIQDFSQVQKKENIFDIRTLEHVMPMVRTVLKNSEVSYQLRGESMITIPCLSRDASIQERKNFDPDKKKRIACIETIRPFFGKQYNFFPGGDTSIDISLYNKADGLRFICDYFGWTPQKQALLFFGDNFGPYGNDSPLEAIEGLSIIRVQCPQHTLEILPQFLSSYL